MIFAVLEIERDPPQWANLYFYLAAWVQVAGGLAAVALVLWGLHFFAEKKHLQVKKISGRGKIFIVLAVLAVLCYGGFFASFAARGPIQIKMSEDPGAPSRLEYQFDQYVLLTAGGALALSAVAVPMLLGLVRRLSFRRIGAISRLSIKEAVRQRIIIVVFLLITLIFLFAPYFIDYKEENQLRNYVQIIYTPMALLFFVTAAFLGAFSIPNDVQRQTIHTVVTKPVEKYEIVMGRFFGYGFLLTVVMAALTVLGLGYLIRGVNPRATQESYKARVPVFADRLFFLGTDNPQGENVGREWEYRKYIHGRNPGSNAKRQYAVWGFQDLGSDLLSSKKPVTLELTFDIFRTTKAKEGHEGVLCTLTVVPGNLLFNLASGSFNLKEIDEKVEKLNDDLTTGKEEIAGENKSKEQQAEAVQRLEDKLCEKHGVYRNAAILITDYHTQSLTVPAGLLKKLDKIYQETPKIPGQPVLPAMVVLVNINEEDPYSVPQYVGAARHDLYVLASELPFWQNYCKMMIGLWCNTILILGVAIACSTYLSGIISLLFTVFLLGAGAVVDYIRTLAAGINPGGGPFESANRLLYRVPMAETLEKTAAVQVGSGLDEIFRWVLGQVLNLIPDIHRFNLTDYVAEGFNISWGQMIFLDNVLPLIGYLIPWGILAYYLINYREIANPT